MCPFLCIGIRNCCKNARECQYKQEACVLECVYMYMVNIVNFFVLCIMETEKLTFLIPGLIPVKFLSVS